MATQILVLTPKIWNMELSTTQMKIFIGKSQNGKAHCKGIYNWKMETCMIEIERMIKLHEEYYEKIFKKIKILG